RHLPLSPNLSLLPQPPPTQTYTPSLHDALPICKKLSIAMIGCGGISEIQLDVLKEFPDVEIVAGVDARSERLKVMEEKYGVKQRSEEHRSELQSPYDLVCRLLLEKKKVDWEVVG